MESVKVRLAGAMYIFQIIKRTPRTLFSFIEFQPQYIITLDLPLLYVRPPVSLVKYRESFST